MTYTYEFPRPALTVDCVVFGRSAEGLHVVLIKRKRDPFAGCWAIPGGFVEMDETLETAALRELEEETTIRLDAAEQLYAFSAVDRDPRERVIAVAHYAIVDRDAHNPRGSDDASDARWFPLNSLPKLAFDHAEILAMARKRIG